MSLINNIRHNVLYAHTASAAAKFYVPWYEGEREREKDLKGCSSKRNKIYRMFCGFWKAERGYKIVNCTLKNYTQTLCVYLCSLSRYLRFIITKKKPIAAFIYERESASAIKVRFF